MIFTFLPFLLYCFCFFNHPLLSIFLLPLLSSFFPYLVHRSPLFNHLLSLPLSCFIFSCFPSPFVIHSTVPLYTPLPFSTITLFPLSSLSQPLSTSLTPPFSSHAFFSSSLFSSPSQILNYSHHATGLSALLSINPKIPCAIIPYSSSPPE